MPKDRLASQFDRDLAPGEQLRLFDGALGNMAQGLCMFDAEQRLIVCNRRYLEMYGFSPDVVKPGMTLGDIVAYSVSIGNFTPVEAEPTLAARPVQAKLRDPATFEQRLSDGRIIAIMHRPLAEGGSVATYDDVTESRRQDAERDLLSRRLAGQVALFQSALDNMIQGLCMFDAEQRLIVCNSRYLDMYGFSPDVVKPGITLHEILEYSVELGNYTPNEAEFAVAERPVQAASRYQATFTQHLADGRAIAVMHQPTPDGGSVATYHDVTRRLRREKEYVDMARQAAAAEAADRAKAAFLANIGDELMKPLAEIARAADGFLAGSAGADGTSGEGGQAADIGAKSRKLYAAMAELLDAPETIGAEIELEEAPTDLVAVVRDAVTLASRVAAAQRISVRYAAPDNPIALNCDGHKLRHAVGGILDHALSYTLPDGEVSVGVSLGEEDPDAPVEIVVADTGVGMAPEDIAQTMAPSVNVEGVCVPRHDSANPGLPVARAFVEAHGGTFRIDSEPGKGTTVRVRLPAERLVFERERKNGSHRRAALSAGGSALL